MWTKRTMDVHTVVVVERSEAKVTNVHETADSAMLIVVPRILKGTIGTQAKLVSWPASHTRHGVRGAAMRSMGHRQSCTAVNAQSVVVDAHNKNGHDCPDGSQTMWAGTPGLVAIHVGCHGRRTG